MYTTAGVTWAAACVKSTSPADPTTAGLFKLANCACCFSSIEVTCPGFSKILYMPSAISPPSAAIRSEEHTSELHSLMRISYAVFCLKKKKKHKNTKQHRHKPMI